MITVVPGVAIDEAELRFEFGPSSGPGGQNVNKVNTRATLWWDLEASPALEPEQKQLVRERLGSRITKQGLLRISAQAARSQLKNREAALERFVELLRAALTIDKPRHETRVPRGAKQARRDDKRRRALRLQRRRVKDED